MLDPEKKYDMQDNGNFDVLDLTGLDIKIDVPRIDLYPNEQYALLRKHGLGTSDSSILCGVNPYTTLSELIAEKCRNYLTPEEKEIGNKAAVKKGRDCEPIIIDKFERIMKRKNIKPVDMYVHKEYPWIKFNFDGILDKDESGQYIPDEIKVVTMYGQKHYNPSKAWYRESVGYTGVPFEDHSKENNSIETKAAEYGIPAYYYTQLQQQIFGLNAPYGYLTVMFDKDWEVVSFFIPRDEVVINDIITNGYKAWQNILKITGDPNYGDTTALQEQFKSEPEPEPETGIGYKPI